MSSSRGECERLRKTLKARHRGPFEERQRSTGSPFSKKPAAGRHLLPSCVTASTSASTASSRNTASRFHSRSAICTSSRVSLELNRPANTENKAIDIIIAGVVFVLHVLGIRCNGNIIIENKTPVDLGDLRVVDLIFTV